MSREQAEEIYKNVERRITEEKEADTQKVQQFLTEVAERVIDYALTKSIEQDALEGFAIDDTSTHVDLRERVSSKALSDKKYNILLLQAIKEQYSDWYVNNDGVEFRFAFLLKTDKNIKSEEMGQ